MPAMFLSVTKGDFITALTGLTYERAAFFHAWFATLMFLMMTAHVGIIGFYWAHPNYDIAPKYPKTFMELSAMRVLCFGIWQCGLD